MTNDERMDEIARAARATYNSPPQVPRADMWAAIEAARSSRPDEAGAAPALYVVPAAASAAAARPASRSTTARSVSAPRRATWWSMAAAAVILVAAGVGIGRLSIDNENGANVGAVATAVSPATEQAGNPPQETDTGVADQGPLSATPVRTLAQSLPEAAAERGDRRSPASRSATLRTVAARDRQPASQRLSARRGADIPGSQSVIPYQVATIRHLTDAEALLTSFTLESRDERTDSRIAGWAKGLLSNTRLLLDSPAGDDPRRAKLLEDLELVLAQIVQLSPGAAAQERDLIDGSIRNGAVMTRLRTAIPAGPTRGFQER